MEGLGTGFRGVGAGIKGAGGAALQVGAGLQVCRPFKDPWMQAVHGCL